MNNPVVILLKTPALGSKVDRCPVLCESDVPLRIAVGGSESTVIVLAVPRRLAPPCKEEGADWLTVVEIGAGLIPGDGGGLEEMGKGSMVVAMLE